MVTGAPAKMLDRREELTPMLSQYVELAETYDDAILLFRVGDFYKAFCEAANEVARICELTRIEREDSTGTYTACGIPVESAASYLDRLLAAGHRLAVADQVEDPEETTGLVDRAVTRIVTPGTVVDDELLETAGANYLGCVARPSGNASAGDDADVPSDDTLGFAHVDVSTGECAVTSGPRAAIRAELARVDPAELVVGPAVGEETLAALDTDATVTRHEPDALEPDAAADRLRRYAAVDRFAPSERVAAGGLLAYAEYTQGDEGPLSYVARVRQYDPRRSLQLDATALRGLELFEAHTPSGRTLLETVDETRSALGRRRLESWLRRPLVDPDQIAARHDAVAALAEASLVRAEVRDHLDAVYDLERLVSRAARERADARDLRSLVDTLGVVPELRDALDGIDALAELRAELDPLADLCAYLDDAIQPDPPREITEGGVIRDGFDDELDELRATAREGREWVADLEARERERTGIENLEVGHTQVHGYYIEVTNSHLDAVPEEYTRRQTLKNSERFYTPALKRREDEILGAEERADSLEYEVFTRVRERVADASDRIQALADAVARLDALAGLATVAVDRNYTRPTVFDPLGDESPGDESPGNESGDPANGGLLVERGRHPVVERTESEFVPNDTRLPRGSVTLLTGPNMSGKSTYMRQIALAVVLAQAGSFVPAETARLPVVDRVFTRVGASDDIAGGESTFMREMTELQEILHDATERSLVLLDEVGRGTSTADGRAIARAAVEFLHDELGATTVFATHYHDLTDLADRLPRVRNRHLDATRTDGDVTFRHRVREGPASSSYGVRVAEMAGLPTAVVDRARELVGDEPAQRTLAEIGDVSPETENGHERPARPRDGDATGSSTDDGGLERADTHRETGEPGQTDDPAATALLAELADVPVAETTPLEALQTLHDLSERADETLDEEETSADGRVDSVDGRADGADERVDSADERVDGGLSGGRGS
jgi:DNA mismatch repair protein MutS